MTSAEFIFHPVGQGLFYTGRIGLFNFVYDCGSDTDTRRLHRIIGNHSEHSGRIDLLIISHFHRDHINGIPELMRSNHVGKVIIPYIQQEEILLRFVEAERDKEATDVLKYCAAQLYGSAMGQLEWGNESRVAIMRPKGHQEADGETINISDLPGAISHDSSFVIHNGEYVFRFFCYTPKADQSVGQWVQELERGFGSDWRARLADIILRDFKKLKSIYGNVFKSNERVNLTSTICCHGPRNALRCRRATLQTYGQNTFYAKYSPVLHARQLLTGDIDLRVAYKQIKAHFKQEWDEIFLCLVPHHGSQKNWKNHMFLSLSNCCFWPCTFGLGNKYGHPSSTIVEQFLARKKHLLQCTQDPASKITIAGEFH